MSEPSPERLNICPVCTARVCAEKSIIGIWDGTARSRAGGGLLHGTTCQTCGAELLAFPAPEEEEAGEFLWVPEADC